jgi:DNA helicase-2/ATP-dependent DNA helicase PcrA
LKCPYGHFFLNLTIAQSDASTVQFNPEVSLDILHNLNPQQKEAVTANPGQILVLAGPGSGKTRVLTQRIAYLIYAMGVKPYQLLAVTFTNKAAREMESRVKRILTEDLEGLWLGTFHAICARLLRHEAQFLPFNENYVIMDSDDQEALVKRVFKELDLDDKLYNPFAIREMISRAKNNLVLPKEFVTRSYMEEVARRVYERYQQLLENNNAVDFDDLLLWAVRLLEDQPEVRAKYAQRFAHVLVDEFQDTNLAQYEIVRLFSSVHHSLFVVGDEDQSIYRWRGADYRNILRFEADYPKARKILLEQNYRSTQNVLNAARAVIDQNKTRTPKALFTDRGEGQPITLYEAVDDYDEAAFAVDSIRQQLETNEHTGGDFAIMYRTNAQSRLLEEAFLRASIPYRLVGAQRFYGRREVKDLIAFLRLVHNPDDEISLGRVINIPPRGIGEKTLVTLQLVCRQRAISAGQLLIDLGEKGEDSQFWADFSNRGGVVLADFGRQLAKWRKLNESSPLPEVFDRILQDSGYKEYIEEGSEIGQSRWENVLELRRLAFEFSELGMNAFLENVALVSDQDTLPETLNAPTLLTLHAAKGLEFPVVFIIGLDDGWLPHNRSFDEPEQMAEERRLFYVGITRAKDQLYLVRADQRSSFGSFTLTQPSRFLNDIPEKLLKRQGVHIQRSHSQRYGALERWESLQQSGSQKKQPKSNPVTPRFRPGMRVLHATWGEGMVIECRVQDDDEVLGVAFESVGIKRLAASLAKLEIISS